MREEGVVRYCIVCSVMERSMEAMLLLLFFLNHFIEVSGDVGTAASYDPPYLPTKCPDYSSLDQLPETGLFVAAGSGVWDNGAACGRKYQVRCLSGLQRPCKDGSIVVEVVDYCRSTPCPATFLLSNKAFGVVSTIRNAMINIEFTEI